MAAAAVLALTCASRARRPARPGRRAADRRRPRRRRRRGRARRLRRQGRHRDVLGHLVPLLPEGIADPGKRAEQGRQGSDAGDRHQHRKPGGLRKAARMQGEAMHLELANDADGRAQEAFGVRGIPHMVIIGRDGRILRVYRGYSEEKLDAIVADINAALGAAALRGAVHPRGDVIGQRGSCDCAQDDERVAARRVWPSPARAAESRGLASPLPRCDAGRWPRLFLADEAMPRARPRYSGSGRAPIGESRPAPRCSPRPDQKKTPHRGASTGSGVQARAARRCPTMVTCWTSIATACVAACRRNGDAVLVAGQRARGEEHPPSSAARRGRSGQPGGQKVAWSCRAPGAVFGDSMEWTVGNPCPARERRATARARRRMKCGLARRTGRGAAPNGRFGG